MAKRDQEAKERIIRIATELLLDTPEQIDRITVRQIAELANVGIGSINYYFGSRDNLLSLAIGGILAKMADRFLDQMNNSDLMPVDRLKSMVKELCNVAVANETLIQFTLTQGIINGDMHTPLYLVPILKQIFGSKKEEIELRVIALQILHPIQIAGIAPAEFRMYSGIDLYDTAARNNYIDMLIDNLVNPENLE